MFFKNRQQLLYIITWLSTIWMCSFLAGFAFGQDCTLTTVVNYNDNGSIVNSTQKYVCKTPPPPPTIIVAETKLTNAEPKVMYGYNGRVYPPVSDKDIMNGLSLLSLFFSN